MCVCMYEYVYAVRICRELFLCLGCQFFEHSSPSAAGRTAITSLWNSFHLVFVWPWPGGEALCCLLCVAGVVTCLHLTSHPFLLLLSPSRLALLSIILSTCVFFILFLSFEFIFGKFCGFYSHWGYPVLNGLCGVRPSELAEMRVLELEQGYVEFVEPNCYSESNLRLIFCLLFPTLFLVWTRTSCLVESMSFFKPFFAFSHISKCKTFWTCHVFLSVHMLVLFSL